MMDSSKAKKAVDKAMMAKAVLAAAAQQAVRETAPGSRVQHVAPHVQWSIRAVRTRSERTALATLGCTERA